MAKGGSRETKFGYGFLFAGAGLPYLIDKLFGPVAALVGATVCLLAGIGFLVAGHLDRESQIRWSRGVMATVGLFALIGAASGALLGGISGAIWSIAHKGTSLTTMPSAPSDAKPPTLSDLFKSDLGNTMKLTDEDRIGVQFKNGDVVRVKTQLYTDFAAKVKYVGFYIPASAKTYEACLQLVDAVESTIQSFQERVGVSAGYRGERNRLQELIFSGRVLLYHEEFLTIPQKAAIIGAYSAKHFDVQFRGPDYLGDQVIAWHHQHETKETR